MSSGGVMGRMAMFGGGGLQKTEIAEASIWTSRLTHINPRKTRYICHFVNWLTFVRWTITHFNFINCMLELWHVNRWYAQCYTCLVTLWRATVRIGRGRTPNINNVSASPDFLLGGEKITLSYMYRTANHILLFPREPRLPTGTKILFPFTLDKKHLWNLQWNLLKLP